MRVANTIHVIRLVGNRAYLIAGNQLVLIDSGLPFQANRIMRFIRDIGRRPDELAHIILTHHHIDHRGSARALKSLTGAKVAASKNDIPFIEGRARAYRESLPWWVKLLHFITDLWFREENVSVDTVLQEGDTIQGLRVIHTPGHTPGSISLFHIKEKALFCGDTVPYTLGKLKKPNPYTVDRAQEMASIRKLAAIECLFLLPNDCRIVYRDAQKVLCDFCSRKNARHPSIQQE